MRVHPVGTRALLIEVGDADEAAAWAVECRRRRDEGDLHAAEVVPAARTVLLDGLEGDLVALAREVAHWQPAPVGAQEGALVELEVRFDGPDLDRVAAHWGLGRDDAVAALLAAELRVAFTGFAPGFGYMTGLPGPVPRRETPRPAVPAGSVALAGEYAGVYPRRSPGGWQLIGHTAALMFDPEREPPALLTPGTRVRMVAR